MQVLHQIILTFFYLVLLYRCNYGITLPFWGYLMEQNEMICMRCHGRKKIYKMGAGYSHVDIGGVKVDCPMCLGSGVVKTIEEALKEVDTKSKSRKIKDEETVA